MNRLRADEITDIALKAGCIVLENGGETYRTEDTIMRIASSLGACSPSSFVTPTVVMLSFTDAEGKHYSAMRRIIRRGVNLRKVALINELSRRIERRKKEGRTQDFPQIEYVLRRIHCSQTYASWVILLCAACSSFVFALMFAGSFKDALGALVVGFVLRLIVMRLEKMTLNGFILSMIYGAAVSVLSELAFSLDCTDSALTVTTAVLLQVVPGLAIVNAIRDIIAGDLVSGAARTLEAFMVAAGLSAGSVLGLLVFSRLTGALL